MRSWGEGAPSTLTEDRPHRWNDQINTRDNANDHIKLENIIKYPFGIARSVYQPRENSNQREAGNEFEEFHITED